MTENSSSRGDLLGRAVRALKTMRKLGAKPALRPWLLAAAAIAFLVMLYASFTSLDQDWRSLDLRLVVPLVLVGIPLALPFNALEYRIMARSLGHHVGFRSAAQVSVVAGMANYLPAPGALAVRTAALKGRGSSLGAAVSINALTGILWLGTAALATGLALLLTPAPLWQVGMALAAGAAAVGGSAVWAWRRSETWRRDVGQLLLVEAGLVVGAGLRLWLAILAIGESASFAASVVISSSTVIAAAIGIFPAGLGLKEAIGGALAAGVGVPIATAVAALSVTRLAGLVGMGICAPLVGIRRRPGRNARTGRPVDDPTTVETVSP